MFDNENKKKLDEELSAKTIGTVNDLSSTIEPSHLGRYDPYKAS